MKTKGAAGAAHRTPEETKQRNLAAYGLKIKAFRLRAGMSADALAAALGISRSSVRNWECGLTRPDPEFLCAMFRVLDVEPNEFFGLSGVGGSLTAGERGLLRDYRSLDEAGREDLRLCASAMAGRAWERKLASVRARILEVGDWGRCAAAGDGEDWPEYPERAGVLLYKSPETARADEIVTVCGRSMEPQFHDGDRVLVEHRSELRNGDIGIFHVPGLGGVIKQKCHDRLHSLNPDYDDIFPYEEGARAVGRVLGVIRPDMVPAREEQLLYAEAAGAGIGP